MKLIGVNASVAMIPLKYTSSEYDSGIAGIASCTMGNILLSMSLSVHILLFPSSKMKMSFSGSLQKTAKLQRKTDKTLT